MAVTLFPGRRRVTLGPGVVSGLVEVTFSAQEAAASSGAEGQLEPLKGPGLLAASLQSIRRTSLLVLSEAGRSTLGVLQ